MENVEKVIILLDGKSEGKNIFIDTIKNNGYWTWNINPFNPLHASAYNYEFDGERNGRYYEFIERLKELVDEYFDQEVKYVNRMIENFIANEKTNVLIIHNCRQDVAVLLKEWHQNCFDILLTNKEVENSSYCKTLDYSDPNYVENVLSVMSILTKPFEQKSEEKGE